MESIRTMLLSAGVAAMVHAPPQPPQTPPGGAVEQEDPATAASIGVGHPALPTTGHSPAAQGRVLRGHSTRDWAQTGLWL